MNPADGETTFPFTAVGSMFTRNEFAGEVFVSAERVDDLRQRHD